MFGRFIGTRKHCTHFRGHRPAYTGRSTENKGITRNIKMQQKKAGINNISKTALGFN